jgi:hypothetical protein
LKIKSAARFRLGAIDAFLPASDKDQPDVRIALT